MHTFLRRHHSDVSTMLDYTIHCARGWPPGFAAYLNKQNWRLFVPAGVKFWDIQPPPSS
jgi:hypothetical protein